MEFFSSSLESAVRVDYGRLLEDQLKKWEGGSQHIRGIAEYISNSDDSYIRIRKNSEQEINVEIHSKRGRKIDKLIIKDIAEGMSLEELEERFFQYFESFSGRRQGMNVSGQFGTGGKAYAIMNYKHCWITSTKNGLENKAWFKWDTNTKQIIKGYSKGGYQNKKVGSVNGTTIELIEAHKNNIELSKFVVDLNYLARIRQAIKRQKIKVSVFQREQPGVELQLEYNPRKDYEKIWEFELPENLKNQDSKENKMIIRYFQKPLGNKDAFIDLSDGISSVTDLEVSKYDGRPFSKYVNGELIIRKLIDSKAVKENRKGLEEQNDLTNEIEDFLKAKLEIVINEIQEKQRQKEKERTIEVSNEKIKELSKFLKRCELNFLNDINSKKRSNGIGGTDFMPTNEETDILGEGFQKEIIEGPVKGTWNTGDTNNSSSTGSKNKFEKNEAENDTAILDDPQFQKQVNKNHAKRGLIVLMSDSPEIPESERPVFSEWEEPIVDRDMRTRGIIWINANNPIIVKYREKKENEPLFKEVVANYVLLVVAQYQAQRILDSQPEDERDDAIGLFRQIFFDLQRQLREDKEISFFEEELEEVA